MRLVCRRRYSRRRRVKYAILDHNREEGGHSRLFAKGNMSHDSHMIIMCPIIDKSSLIVSETETEEEILFESKKGKSTEKQALITQQNNGTNTVKNNLSDPSGRAKKTMNTS